MFTAISNLPQKQLRRITDERAVNRDRRFFVKNKRRRTYIRQASEIEEAVLRRFIDAPVNFGFFFAVRQVQRGFRIRKPLIAHMDLVRIPTDDDECSRIFDGLIK